MTLFNARLRELREGAGLTQEQTAERSGINIYTLRGYEQGRREPNWKGLLLLSAVLGVNPTAFADCESVDDASREPAPRGRPPKAEAAPEPTKPARKRKGKGE